MATQRYVIRGGVEGRERLLLLSEVMGPSTRALLAVPARYAWTLSDWAEVGPSEVVVALEDPCEKGQNFS